MPTITVLSWNVQKLGDAKTTRGANPPMYSDIVPFIALVIQRTAADVVGLMEVTGGMGTQIRDWLTACLNNAPEVTGDPWKGSVSARQDGGTKEEFIFLWREKVNRLVLDPAGRPAPTSLVGVVDDNLLAPYIDAYHWTDADKAAMYQALAEAGYIAKGRYRAGRGAMPLTSTWRVSMDKWADLEAAMQPEVDFTGTTTQPPPPFAGPTSQAARQDLARRLVETDVLRFLTYGDRAPFLANFLVGPAPGKPLMTAIYHAPGPQDGMNVIGSAINTIGMSIALANSAAHGNVLVMGDFNVRADQMESTSRAYSRTDQNGNPAWSLVVPAVMQKVFSTITGGDINAADITGTPPTSMTDTYLADDVAADTALVNAYDKFFFHGAAAPGPELKAGTPEVLNLVPYVAQGLNTFDADLGGRAMGFCRWYCGDASATKAANSLRRKANTAQAKLLKAQSDLAAVNQKIALKGKRISPKDTLLDRRAALKRTVDREQKNYDTAQNQSANAQYLARILGVPTTPAPTGTGSAASVLRFAISDHVPIAVQITG